jgi:hypothetical protein
MDTFSSDVVLGRNWEKEKRKIPVIFALPRSRLKGLKDLTCSEKDCAGKLRSRHTHRETTSAAAKVIGLDLKKPAAIPLTPCNMSP